MNVTVPLADQPCIFSDILSLVPPGSYDPDASFLDRYFQLRKQTGTVSSLFPLALHLNVLGPCVFPTVFVLRFVVSWPDGI